MRSQRRAGRRQLAHGLMLLVRQLVGSKGGGHGRREGVDLQDSLSVVRTAAQSRNSPVRGILGLCAGLFAFSLHDLGVKWLSSNYALSELMFVRGITALPLLLLLVQLEAGMGSLVSIRLGPVMLRGVILTVAYLAYYMGLAAIPFADAVALYSTVPLIIVALAGPCLGERVGIPRWLAVLAGLAGVVIMLRPGQGMFEPAGLLILLCATLYSFAMIMTRSLGTVYSASVMTFIWNACYLLLAALLGIILTPLDLAQSAHPSLAFLLRPWIVPSVSDLAIMVSCGVSALIGLTCLTFAYREAEVSLVTSFEYTGLLWAMLWGFLIWAEIPSAGTIIGAALIIGSGLVALFANR
jgi:drug/metabolite transporter (DMT)-like permease